MNKESETETKRKAQDGGNSPATHRRREGTPARQNRPQNRKTPQRGAAKPTSALKIIPLGGLGEIGKNMTALEYEGSIMVIDCGVSFPDEDMLGIDLVIPDITYLQKNAERVRGIVITHGHEDHVGAIPYVLGTLDVPVYATRLTAAIIENKLSEFHYAKRPTVKVVKAGDRIPLGDFRVEFIHVNHSIPDACALAIRTPVGTVFHTGDFKLDTTPIDGRMMDLTRIGEIGNEGVLLMMGESTNAERPGYTPSEKTVGVSFENIFAQNADKRVVVATFSSNVHRVQQIIDAAVRHKRKVAILGRSMVNVIGAAKDLGYMKVPEGTLIDISEIRRFKPNQLCLITTGSQGEPMSALYRLAFGENDRVKLTPQDVVVLSSHPIPGNEKLVGKVINSLTKNGVGVVDTGTADVHVSGHACQEELKLMLALVRPKFFMPVHGESRHLAAHRALAMAIGIPSDKILVGDLGRVLEVTRDTARFNGTVPSGQVFVDGSGVGDVGAVVLRERRMLAEAGILLVAATLDTKDRVLITAPEIISRGFVYQKDADTLMEGARALVMRLFDRSLSRKKPDVAQMKMAIRDELQKYFFRETKRRPVILPLILEM